MKHLLQLSVPAVVLMHCAVAAVAQTYPSRPVTIICPNAPGGPLDSESRVYAQKLQEVTGQPFVIDYKVGAGGRIGITYVTKAAPDGYTVLIVGAALTIIPALTSSPGFEVMRDLAPVSLMTQRASMLLMHGSVPAKSIGELITYSRANPDKLNFGTTGPGGSTDLAGRLLASTAKMPLSFVHYKGTGPLTTDLLAGRVQLGITNLISGMALAKSGKLRLLGVTSPSRLPTMPDVPTLAESGATGYEYVGWTAFLAPARTPAATVDKLSAEMAKVAKLEDTAKRLGSEDIELVGSSPDYLRKHVGAELARWSKVVREAGIKAED